MSYIIYIYKSIFYNIFCLAQNLGHFEKIVNSRHFHTVQKQCTFELLFYYFFSPYHENQNINWPLNDHALLRRWFTHKA